MEGLSLLFFRSEVELTTKMAAKRFCDGNGRQDTNEELPVSIGRTHVHTVSYRRKPVRLVHTILCVPQPTRY